MCEHQQSSDTSNCNRKQLNRFNMIYIYGIVLFKCVSQIYLCQWFSISPDFIRYKNNHMHMDHYEDCFNLDSDHKFQQYYRWSSDLIMVQQCSHQLPLSTFDDGSHDHDQSTIQLNSTNLQHNSQYKPAQLGLQPNFSEPADIKQSILSTKPKKKAKAATGCQCKKTECIKSYCECYSKGNMCSQDCSCQNCKNNIENIEIVQQIKKKKSKDKVNEGGHKCQCHKSKCLKKYCECYNAGVPCGVYCKCNGCQNAEDQTQQN